MPANHAKILTNKNAFTLIELIVVISIIATLMAILLPSLANAKKAVRTVSCLSNIRQMGLAFTMYGMENNEYTMPNYNPQTNINWWGKRSSAGIDHTKGFLYPYLQSELKQKSVYECPSQKYGTYILQGKPPTQPNHPKWITSTYGYNGYYLCPPRSPWLNIRHRPWQKTTSVKSPDKVIAFGDAMLDWDVSENTSSISNNAMIDPPSILSPNGRYWTKNQSPTTSFRHSGKTNILFVDGHCQSLKLQQGQYTSPDVKIGSITENNSPYYVPDYKDWPIGRR